MVVGPDGKVFAVRAGPGVTDASGLTKLGHLLTGNDKLGNLTATVGARALAIESQNPTVGSQLVGYFDNYGGVVNTLTSYANSVNSSNITYGATSTNSNAFAFGAVRELIGFTPSTEYRAFGSDTVLPVNR